MAKVNQKKTRPALNPPQFRLSTLLGSVSLICFILAIAIKLSPLGVMALIVFLLVVLGHVTGALIGSRLRELGSLKIEAEREP